MEQKLKTFEEILMNKTLNQKQYKNGYIKSILLEYFWQNGENSASCASK